MRLLAIVGLFLVISCSFSPEIEDIHLLNGYWEIEKVQFKDGTEKKYSVNILVDLYEIDADKKTGTLKRVSPKYDGTHVVQPGIETLSFSSVKDTLYITYKNNFSSQKSKVLTLNESEFVIQNQEKILYFYKRFIPITVLTDEKK